jgi:hypothetical protein
LTTVRFEPKRVRTPVWGSTAARLSSLPKEMNMRDRIARAALFVLCAAAVGVIGSTLSRRLDAQPVAAGGPVLVQVTPLPRDLVNVDVVMPPLSSGQTTVLYTVPPNRSFVVTDWSFFSPIGSGNFTTLSPEYWEIIEGVSNRPMLGGSAFSFSIDTYSIFSTRATHLSYRSTHGIVFPAGSTIVLSLGNTGGSTQFTGRAHLEGYLSP